MHLGVYLLMWWETSLRLLLRVLLDFRVSPLKQRPGLGRQTSVLVRKERFGMKWVPEQLSLPGRE
jgi:hypothetical protein